MVGGDENVDEVVTRSGAIGLGSGGGGCRFFAFKDALDGDVGHECHLSGVGDLFEGDFDVVVVDFNVASDHFEEIFFERFHLRWRKLDSVLQQEDAEALFGDGASIIVVEVESFGPVAKPGHQGCDHASTLPMPMNRFIFAKKPASPSMSMNGTSKP